MSQIVCAIGAREHTSLHTQPCLRQYAGFVYTFNLPCARGCLGVRVRVRMLVLFKSPERATHFTLFKKFSYLHPHA